MCDGESSALRDLLGELADEWDQMADATTVHGLRDAFRACSIDLRSALTRVLPPGVCMCPEPAAIGTEPCDTCGLPATRPLPPGR